MSRLINSLLLKNQRGAIAVDFVFGLVLVLGLTTIMIALTYTLAVVEVIQYAAFSASRAYFLGNVSPVDQQTAGQTKFQQFTSQKYIKLLVPKVWFALKPEVKDFSEDFPASDDGDRYYEGVRVQLQAKMLDIKIPFYGSTANQGGASGFKTRVNSFLGREVTQTECNQFMRARWEKIKGLPVSGGAQYTQFMTNNTNVFAGDDNGC
jgi:hypothetical protein